ncbi:MAG: class I SAM-dependent methyltransferase [Candidatus Pacebacteria bacterium]|nr:class I SAM-dependent methyltransferase [Candidatus Paceibacterota bacterium]
MKNAYTILDFAEYYRVTVRELPSDIILEREPLCPCCDIEMNIVCALVAHQGKQILNIGACPECGTRGYIDRPSRQWIEEFYTDTWDIHTALNAEQVRAFPRIELDKKSSRRVAAIAASSLDVARRLRALDIGVGYGSILRHFQESGFGEVVGVEHSPHRADVVARAFDAKVCVGPFESDDVQSILRHNKPFDAIVSHHVFEHVVDPRRFIRCASELQARGGIFVLAVPDALGEHAGYQALYPPHLYSYTKYGIETLLMKHGYEVIEDVSPTFDNMILKMIRVDKPSRRFFTKDPRAFQGVLERFEQGLGFNQGEVVKRYGVFWLQPNRSPHDFTRIPMRGFQWRIQSLYMKLLARIGRYRSDHAMYIGPAVKKYSNAPFELQWDGPLRLLFK